MSAVIDSQDRFLTSHAYGSFRPRQPEIVTAEGEWVEEGQIIGSIESSQGLEPVRSPWRGWVVSYLVSEGERVRPGTELVHVVEA